MSLAQARPPGSGVAFTWPAAAFSEAENAPCVRVRQYVVVWKAIAPASAEAASHYTRYNWDSLDTEIAAAMANHQKIMAQINCGPPAWVFDTVAQVGFSRGEKAPQFWDPAYIAFYKTLVTAFANKIKSLTPAQRALFVGVRMQSNAFNTEISHWNDIPSTEIGSDINAKMPVIVVDGKNTGDRSKWIRGDGTPFGPDLTDTKYSEGSYAVTYQEDYLREMIQHYYAVFTTGELAPPQGIHTALRTFGLFKHVNASYLESRFVDYPFTMALDTGGEAGILDETGVKRLRYDLFRQRCRNPGTPGNARGYWEDFKESFTPVDGHTPVNGNANQEFYWRQLAKLDAGACYGAVYGKDLARWRQGGSAFAGYTQGIAFFNQYAGYANEPASSPGAWIAFVNVPAIPSGRSRSAARSHLGYFIDHLNATETGVTDHRNIGSGVNHEGMYARSFGEAAVAAFAIFPDFAAQLSPGYTIKVVWYSPTTTTWRLQVRDAMGTLTQVGAPVTGNTPGGWATATFRNVTPVPAGGGTERLPDFTLTNMSGNAYFHLIEIVKTGGKPASASSL